MKRKFEVWFRAALVLLVVVWGWALWASAQTATNKTASATNPPSNLVGRVEQWETNPVNFNLNQIPFLRDHRFLGEPLWKYLASLLYILLAFLVTRLIDWVTRVWLKKLAARTETELDDLLLELLHGPIKVVVFVILLNIGLNIFDWSNKAKVYFSKGLIVIVAGSLTYLAVKVINLLLNFWRRRHAQEADRKFDDQLFSVLRISLNTFVIVVAVLVTAQNLDINITAGIASLSIGGLAVGLAAQDTLANLFGAVAVFVDKPFRVGDQIKVEGAEGIVEAVGLRSTRVRSNEGFLVAVPNKTMGNATITNVSKRPGIKTVLNLALPKSCPSQKVKRALVLLGEVYRSHPKTREACISFNQFAGGNVNIQIIHWWNGTDQQQYLTGMQEMNLAVKERFELEQIEFA